MAKKYLTQRQIYVCARNRAIATTLVAIGFTILTFVTRAWFAFLPLAGIYGLAIVFWYETSFERIFLPNQKKKNQNNWIRDAKNP